MGNNSRILTLNPEIQEGFSLEQIALVGAQKMLKMALEAEIQSFLEGHSTLMDDGKMSIVRNGYNNEREVTIGVGALQVKVPRTRNRSGEAENYVSAIIPPYMKRSLKLEETLPLMYLYGISTKDFVPALEKLLGSGTPGLSASNISHLKKIWEQEHTDWSTRDLKNEKYCYVWVDGIHFKVRNSSDDLCILVMMGVNYQGEKKLIAVESGYRESTDSWAALLRQLKSRGMACPKLFIGDGALGFWAAKREVFPEAKEQRCWEHKKRNVLDKLPKSVQSQAKSLLNEIQMAPSVSTAVKAIDKFEDVYDAKYPEAVKCLKKNEEELLAFYEFPAEHWIHIRTSNPIESTFSTVRLRTKKTRSCGARKTIHAMVFKLLEVASKRWRKIRAYTMIEKVIDDSVIFEDGLEKAA